MEVGVSISSNMSNDTGGSGRAIINKKEEETKEKESNVRSKF